MTMLEPETESIAVSPTLRKRILEVMEEKGKAYSQQAIANRLGIHYDTLRKKLRGDSKITMFELRRISELLHLPIERLLEQDTSEMEKELKSLFDAIVDPDKTKAIAKKIFWKESTAISFANGGYIDLVKQRALEIAQHLVSVAIGVTERSKSLNELGRAYFHLQRYNEAHDSWLEAYNYAKNLSDKSNEEKEPLFRIIANLTISFSNRKEYSELAKITKNIEPVIESDPNRAGIIYYSLAKITEHNREIDQAREYYYKYLEANKQTEILFKIAKAIHNVACFEFRMGDYVTSKILFEQSLPILKQGQMIYEQTSLKDYCKTLLKLGENSKAVEILEKSIAMVFPKDLLFLKAKMLILLSLAMNVHEYAESIFEMDIDDKVKMIACKFLMDFFCKKGDSQSLMKYYKVSSDFTNRDILVEEEF